MATDAPNRLRTRLRGARTLFRALAERAPEQLARLEHYGAHLAQQNDRAATQLDRLEHYGAHLAAQNDRSLGALERMAGEVTQLRAAVGSQRPSRPTGLLPFGLVVELARVVGIRRAIETGTAGGDGTRLLTIVFPEVASVELSPWLHRHARARLAGIEGLTLVQGDSRELLADLIRAAEPTLYWLDGHWNSDPSAAGQGDQCPLLEEIEALAGGHADDCILIDDARFLAASPPPPFDRDDWPGLLEVMQRLRQVRPDSYVTTVQDLVIAVPSRTKPIIDAFAWGHFETPPPELTVGPPPADLGRDESPADPTPEKPREPSAGNGRAATLRAAVDAVPRWWHTVDLGDGVVTPGQKGGSPEYMQTELASLHLPDLHDKTVLDVGAWDGFYSFEAERQGASRVVALDHYVWSLGERGRWDPEGLPGKRGFDVAHSALSSRVETVVGDFMSADLAALGTFDVVLFLGVLYHLEDPLAAMRRVHALTGELAVIESEAIAVPSLEPRAMWEFFSADQLNADRTTWWAPSGNALVELCRAAGFTRADAVQGPPPPRPGEPLSRYRAVVHAWV